MASQNLLIGVVVVGGLAVAYFTNMLCPIHPALCFRGAGAGGAGDIAAQRDTSLVQSALQQERARLLTRQMGGGPQNISDPRVTYRY